MKIRQPIEAASAILFHELAKFAVQSVAIVKLAFKLVVDGSLQARSGDG